jgi:hypothetical protein
MQEPQAHIGLMLLVNEFRFVKVVYVELHAYSDACEIALKGKTIKSKNGSVTNVHDVDSHLSPTPLIQLYSDALRSRFKGEE